jgi:hypothetical protein
MEKYVDETRGKKLAKPKHPSKHWAEIGNGVKSQTLLPNVYSTPASNIIYCDCPGFHDTRTEEDRLNITIATQLMVNSAKSIKGIVVVIDPNALEYNAVNMRSLSLTLSQLLQGKVNPNSILFVFNKKGSSKKTLNQILHNVGEVTESEESKLKQLTTSSQGGTEIENVRQVVSLLKSITPENALVIDIFDNFKSKSELEQLLQRIVATPKEGFNFSGYDTTRIEFEKQLAEIVREMTSKLIEFVQTNEGIHTNTELLSSCQSRINAYQKPLQRFEAAVLANTDNRNKEVKKLEEQVANHKNKIKELELEKQKTQDKITTLATQKGSLDTDEEVLYWQDSNGRTYTPSLTKSYTKGGTRFLGMTWGGTTVEPGPRGQVKWFQYRGAPFSRVARSIGKGKFEKEVINKENGYYEGKLVPDWEAESYDRIEDEDGLPIYTCHATVSIYIKKKDTPEHKKQIQQFELEIKEEQERINKYDQAMQQSYQACGSIQKTIEFHKIDAEKQKAEIANRMKEVKEQIERAEREKKDLESTNKLLIQKLNETKAYLVNQQSLINAISSLISQGICKESSLFTSFKEHYKLYQMLQQGLLLEANFPRELECPFTLDMFNDPVMIIKCGHTFSSAPLLEHLEKQKFCPTCKKSVAFEDIVPNITVREQVEAFRTKKAAEAKKKLEEAKNAKK